MLDTHDSRPVEGGDALLAALAGHGVRQVFSVSGGPINSIYHAATRQPVGLVHVRHEAAAGFMADAVYRTTGVPGVVVATLGPGVANTVTPAATATSAGVPLLIVGGQASTARLHRGAGMEMDTLRIMTPVTKWAAQVLHADRIGEFVDEAWRRMTAGTPGPVYLEIPTNVLSSVVASVPSSVTLSQAPPTPPAATAARIAELLASARRPVLLAGDGIYHAGASVALRALVESASLPVATLRLARGSVDERRCPWWFGPGYVPANPVLGRALAEADVVLLLGHHWEFDLEFGAGVADAATVVQVHHDAAQLGRNGRVDLAVHADTGAFLATLPPAAGDRDTGWCTGLAREWASVQDGLIEAGTGGGDARPHPLAVVDEVVAAMPDETVYVTSHGNVDFWADARLRISRPGGYLRVGQGGALGAEVPFGVSAALTDRNAPVVVFVGDGGVGYHVTELETAARHGARVTVVVLDDSSWGAIAIPQRAAYGVEVEMDLPRRDWASVARSLGGYGEAVEDLAGVRPAMLRALASDGPALVQTPVRSVLSPYMRHIS